MSRPSRAWPLLCGTLLLVLPLSLGTARSSEPEAHPFATGEVPEAAMIDIPFAALPFPGILTAGQPTPEQLRVARDLGFKTVINLRPPKEQGDWDEAAEVSALGLQYVLIPVDGAPAVTLENSKRLVEALDDPASYPVLVHCASSNRVGALFAIDAATRRGESVEDAIRTGQSAGMKSLEPKVRGLLQGK